MELGIRAGTVFPGTRPCCYLAEPDTVFPQGLVLVYVTCVLLENLQLCVQADPLTLFPGAPASLLMCVPQSTWTMFVGIFHQLVSGPTRPQKDSYWVGAQLGHSTSIGPFFLHNMSYYKFPILL